MLHIDRPITVKQHSAVGVGHIIDRQIEFGLNEPTQSKPQISLKFQLDSRHFAAKDRAVCDDTSMRCHSLLQKQSSWYQLIPADGSAVDLAVITPQGPTLNGIVGRPAGIIEGYTYLKGMRVFSETGAVRDCETLDSVPDRLPQIRERNVYCLEAWRRRPRAGPGLLRELRRLPTLSFSLHRLEQQTSCSERSSQTTIPDGLSGTGSLLRFSITKNAHRL